LDVELTTVPWRRAERDEVDHVVFHLQYSHVVALHYRQAWNAAETRVGRRAAAEYDVRLTDTYSYKMLSYHRETALQGAL